MNRTLVAIGFAILGLALAAHGAATDSPARRTLEYAAAPVDNPLKGLVPYAGDKRAMFPHSMEFNYLPFSALVTGDDRYDWKALEDLLDAVSSRGHQTVFRVYLEFPDRKDSIPAFLLDGGLKLTKVIRQNPPPHPPGELDIPDYSDPNLRRAMTLFIAALGKRYDGDPRVGFITAGLLGTWGEWHDYPRNDLFAGKEVQAEVMDAYESAFKTTPILLRYPAGEGNPQWAPNATRRFGYHDDSFAWWTIETGEKNQGWYFAPLTKAAGRAATDKWKTMPIGGEIRPEAWGKVFDDRPDVKQIQDFGKCVEATHVTWLMDSGMFKKERDAGRVERAEEQVRRMGYELHVPAVTVGAAAGGTLEVKLEIENRGVAPFYYDWPAEFGLLGAGGRPAKTFRAAGKITGILPGDKPRVWEEKLPLEGVKPGDYALALRVPNPMPKGIPLRFANAGQDRDAAGWLTLAPVVVP